MNCIERLLSMPRIYEVSRFNRKEYIGTMALLLLFNSIILAQGFFRGEITDLMYAVTIFMIPLYIRACKLRLNDAGMRWIWLLLPLSGVGTIYLLWLMLFKPSTTEVLRKIGFTNERGEETEFDLLDSFMYDEDRFMVLGENNKENNPCSVIILRVKSSNLAFDTVDDELATEVYTEFIKRNGEKKYEYV